MKFRSQIFGLLLYLGLITNAAAQPTNTQSLPTENSVRQTTIAKLKSIYFPEVKISHTNLAEVVRQLNATTKQYDPNKTGVSISITTNSVTNSIEEINSIVIEMAALSEVRLSDVLDAVDIVAEKPLQHIITPDGRVVFSIKPAPQLYTRVFRINTNAFIAVLNQITNYPVTNPMWQHPRGISSADSNHGIPPETNQPPTISMKTRFLFAEIGVNGNSPPGKCIFYNDRLGQIFVKATPSDLDLIEKAISQLQLN